MTDSNVQIKIPEQLISDMVRAEIVKNLGDTGEMVQAVIQQALREKEQGYNRETKFGDACNTIIRAECLAIFREWIEEQKPSIRKALLQRLTVAKSKNIKDLVDGIIKGLTPYNCSVSLSWEE